MRQLMAILLGLTLATAATAVAQTTSAQAPDWKQTLGACSAAIRIAMMPSDRLTNADTSAVATTKRGCRRKGPASPETTRTTIAAALTGTAAATVVDCSGQNIGNHAARVGPAPWAGPAFSCSPPLQAPQADALGSAHVAVSEGQAET